MNLSQLPNVSWSHDAVWFFGGLLCGWLSVVLFDVAAHLLARRKARRG